MANATLNDVSAKLDTVDANVNLLVAKANTPPPPQLATQAQIDALATRLDGLITLTQPAA